MLYLLFGVILLGVVVMQFLTREVYFRPWNPLGPTVHRDEWPWLYWPVMLAELALAAFLIHRYFTRFA